MGSGQFVFAVASQAVASRAAPVEGEFVFRSHDLIEFLSEGIYVVRDEYSVFWKLLITPLTLHAPPAMQEGAGSGLASGEKPGPSARPEWWRSEMGW